MFDNFTPGSSYPLYNTFPCFKNTIITTSVCHFAHKLPNIWKRKTNFQCKTQLCLFYPTSNLNLHFKSCVQPLHTKAVKHNGRRKHAGQWLRQAKGMWKSHPQNCLIPFSTPPGVTNDIIISTVNRDKSLVKTSFHKRFFCEYYHCSEIFKSCITTGLGKYHWNKFNVIQNDILPRFVH